MGAWDAGQGLQLHDLPRRLGGSGTDPGSAGSVPGGGTRSSGHAEPAGIGAWATDGAGQEWLSPPLLRCGISRGSIGCGCGVSLQSITGSTPGANPFSRESRARKWGISPAHRRRYSARTGQPDPAPCATLNRSRVASVRRATKWSWMSCQTPESVQPRSRGHQLPSTVHDVIPGGPSTT